MSKANLLYCAETAVEGSTISSLSSQLTKSLHRPTRRTLTLIDKALSWIRPFESAKATPSSKAERQELLAMISTHRWTLCPYIDVDRIESNLLHGRRSS